MGHLFSTFWTNHNYFFLLKALFCPLTTSFFSRIRIQSSRDEFSFLFEAAAMNILGNQNRRRRQRDRILDAGLNDIPTSAFGRYDINREGKKSKQIIKNSHVLSILAQEARQKIIFINLGKMNVARDLARASETYLPMETICSFVTRALHGLMSASTVSKALGPQYKNQQDAENGRQGRLARSRAGDAANAITANTHVQKGEIEFGGQKVRLVIPPGLAGKIQANLAAAKEAILVPNDLSPWKRQLLLHEIGKSIEKALAPNEAQDDWNNEQDEKSIWPTCSEPREQHQSSSSISSHYGYLGPIQNPDNSLYGRPYKPFRMNYEDVQGTGGETGALFRSYLDQFDVAIKRKEFWENRRESLLVKIDQILGISDGPQMGE